MNPPHSFLPGLELGRRFFFEAVAPLLAEGFPELVYSAGLIGSGSEILGFDTPQSTDHHWGPRVMVFVGPQDLSLKPRVDEWLAERLPRAFLGWSTHWGPPMP